uniref:N-terminal methionine N(alpha)-acetyltransferase NatE n=1 Tax=Caenorhabditis tropicalis TaxID=1561998 RepID=A0A1I7U798_9PELO
MSSSPNADSAKPSEMQPDNAPTTSKGKPKVKRENSFYENFVARAARMKISSSAVQNLVNLPDSLRICQITEQNFAEFRILVNLSIEGKHSEEFFDSVKNAPTFSAIAYFDGHPAGFINCYLRNENVCFCVRTMGVVRLHRRHGIAGALLQHAISMASGIDSVEILMTHIEKDIDAIRLFQRFGFTRHREGEDESCGGILQLYVRPVKKIKDAWEKLHKPAAKKAKLDLKKPSGDLRVGQITEIDVERLRALNRQIFADKYDDETHRSILDSPNMSALAFLNDKPVGSMTCEKWDTGDLKLLEVMALGVLSDYKELEDDIKKLLLNHASKMAENSADVHLLTYYVQQDHLATIALLSKFGFTFWLPIPEYYRHNTRNDVYYIKKTSRMFTKRVVATVVDETEEKREGPLDIKFDLKTFDVSKLISINQSLLIADITEDTVESLNQLNTEISPTSNNENLFKNVLVTPNLTRLAFFDGIPCGFIHTEKKLNDDGSFHLVIVTMGVKSDKRRYGIAGELIKHMVQLAQETEDIKFISAFVRDGNDVANRLFERCEFDKCVLPERFGAYARHFFFKLTDN